MKTKNKLALAAIGVFSILFVANKYGGDPHSPEGIRERCALDHPSNVNRSQDRCVVARLYVEALERQRDAENN